MARYRLIGFLLFAACTKDKAASDDTAADAEGPPSPYEMPDRSGCTYRYADDSDLDGVDGHEVTLVYDGSDRVAEETVVWADAYEVYQTWDYDAAGCTAAYTHTLTALNEAYADYEGVVRWTATCDEHGTPIRREGEWMGAAFQVDYTATYDGDDLVAIDAVTTWLAEGTTARSGWTYAWSGGQVIRQEYSKEGTLTEVETWTWSGDLLTDYSYSEPSSPEDDYSYSYSYDTHDRLATLSLSREEGPVWRAERTWYDTIYQEAEISTDHDLDGAVDEVQTWHCTESWPWSCTSVTDGGWQEDVAAPDGMADATAWLSWTCP